MQTLKNNSEGLMRNLLKFAHQSRKPLLLQSHKPIPIATYTPKFSNTASSFLHAKDPDHERAAAAKLKREYRQERKGALRELRRDAAFLARHHQKDQEDKDRRYNATMKH